MDKIRFYLTNRFILFLLLMISFIGINYYYTGLLLPSTETKDLWFYTGLFMLLFSFFFIEPFYTTPKNVITNAIPLLLVYISIKDSFADYNLWIISFSIISALVILSIVAMTLHVKDESENSIKNRIASFIKSIVVTIGQAKVLYSFVFLSILILYKYKLVEDVSESYFYALIMYWGLILVIDTKSIHNGLMWTKKNSSNISIGEIISVKGKGMYLIKVYSDSKSVRKFDLVKFKYSMDDDTSQLNVGFVFDIFSLNQEIWANVFASYRKSDTLGKYNAGHVYKLDKGEINSEVELKLKVNHFVGVIKEGSRIGVIKFEYSKKINDLQEGDLLELFIDGKRIFYQVVAGFTESEHIVDRDEHGFIEGEAIQLGSWVNENLSFEKYGWVPQINTPLYIADTSDVIVPDIKYPEYQLGIIPNTQLPSVINLNEAVKHHLALLGVTGSGKSFTAREIIKALLVDTNVICIDFTGEYIKDLKPLNPTNLIKKDGLEELEKSFADKHAKALAKRPDEELALKKQILIRLDEYVKTFIDGDSNLALFELPALSNTSFILEFTQYFIESVFNYAKNNEGAKICLVLEEAHTIVPETTFLGDLGDYGSTKALVNKMSQIALQGRKYGVGLLVIAQRTANVSKTVLTQCNTIICFQAFDETSFTFLGNYIGKDMVQTLPHLKKYHAIVAGKSVRSNIPMIINLERK